MRRKVLPKARATSVAKRTPARPDDALYARVLDIVEAARKHAARSVNSAMVHAYWMIGREIVVAEQAGAQRAGYGEEVIERLSERLTRTLGKGFGSRTLWRLRQFYQLYPRGSAIAGQAIPTEPRTESRPAKILTGPLSESGPGAAAFPSNLGWSHYLVLLKVSNPEARAFYEIEVARSVVQRRARTPGGSIAVQPAGEEQG